MKLYRFTAPNTHRAILIVHESLGPDALIYSTRKIASGVEVLAGLPLDANEEILDKKVLDKKAIEIKKLQPARGKSKTLVNAPTVDNMVIESLKIQMQTMNESIQVLAEHIATLHEVFIQKFYTKKLSRWNMLKHFNIRKLLRVGFYGRQTTY